MFVDIETVSGVKLQELLNLLLIFQGSVAVCWFFVTSAAAYLLPRRVTLP